MSQPRRDTLLVDVAADRVAAFDASDFVIESPIKTVTTPIAAVTPGARQSQFPRIPLAVKARHTAAMAA